MAEVINKAAIFFGLHIGTTTLLTAATTLIMAGVILWLGRKVLPKERWARSFGLAYFIFCPQYLLLTAEIWQDDFTWIPNAAWPWFLGTVIILYKLASPASNLFFLEAANALRGRRDKKGGFLPRWAIALALLAFLANLLYIGSPFHRLPDALFSFFALYSVGYAFNVSFRAENPFFGSFLLFLGAVYGVVNVFHAFVPWLGQNVPNGLFKALQAAHRLDPSISLTAEQALDGLTIAVRLFLKCLLFVSGFLLIGKCLLTLAPGKKDILEKVTDGDLDYISEGGFTRYLSEKIGSDLVGLWILLPGSSNTCLRFRWFKGNREHSDYLALALPQKSLIANVFNDGTPRSSLNLANDPDLLKIYQPKNGLMAASLITLPIRVHGQVIAVLNCEWQQNWAYTQTTLALVKQQADTLAPVIHIKRQLMAMERLNMALQESNQVDLKESIYELLEKVREVLGTHGAGLYFNVGFRKHALYLHNDSQRFDLKDTQDPAAFKLAVTQEYADMELEFRDMRLPDIETSSRGDSRNQEHGLFFATLIKQAVESKKQGLLLENALFKNMVAKSVRGILYEAARASFAYRLTVLGTQLSQANDPQSWQQPLQEAFVRAGGSWLYAEFSDGSVLGPDTKLETYRGNSFSSNGQDRQLVKAVENSEGISYLLRLRLINSGTTLWGGIRRSGFGLELEAKVSPWCMFVDRMVEIGDNSLSRIFHQEVELELAKADTPTLLHHEVKNQMGSLSLMIDNLDDDLRLKELKAASDRIKDIKDQITHFSEMTRSINKPAGVGLNGDENLGEAFAAAEKRYRDYFNDRKIHLVNEIEGSLKVTQPPDLIVLAFSNLLSNASDAIGNCGTITAKSEVSDQNVKIHIKNDGPAIPPDHFGKIFMRGYTTKKKGTGLGLSIVKNSLVRNNGDLELSHSDGNSTVFTIVLTKKEMANG